MKILIFAASLRKDSYHKKLGRLALQQIQEMGSPYEAELVELNDFEMPIFNEDLEVNGLPASVTAFAQKVSSAHAVIIAEPEYNGCITPILKNTVDWLSRLKPHPWLGKPVFLMAASEGGLGGIRGIYHSRLPFDNLGAHVFGQYFSLPKVHENLESAGPRLKSSLEKFLTFSQRFS